MHPFTNNLTAWYEQHQRTLPWRGEKNPYKIWISEIILQQTRIEQGWNYYLQFTERFPDVASLALAEEDEVLKYWQGLGYYGRARHLHEGAKYIYHDCKNIFPDNYEDILKIKGVGAYTAAAIASMAFDL
ncbi:MAG: A/G-specific adenine glycosylase, partial [Bacteroidales bacterium]|nr:A/G-specific adenine glycosylase [Bacteroidales bacterium]